MSLTIDRSLQKVIAILSRVVEKDKPQITIDSEEDELILSARSKRIPPPQTGSLFVSYRLPVKGKLSRDSVEIDSRIASIALNTKRSSLEIVDTPVDEKGSTSTVSVLEVTDSEQVITTCPLLPSDDSQSVQTVDTPSTYHLTVGELQGAFSWIVRAISKDRGRPQLNSVLLTGARAIATDGHRLHVAPLPIAVGCDSLIIQGGVNTLLDICKTLQDQDPVICRGNAQLMRFELGSWVVICTFPDISFPPYQKVIPEKWERPKGAVIRVNSSRLIPALKKARKVSDGGGLKGVRIVPLEKELKVRSENNQENLKIELKIVASIRGNLQATLFANVDYVLEALPPKGEVEIFVGPEECDSFGIGIGETHSACVVSIAPMKFAVIMPMRS